MRGETKTHGAQGYVYSSSSTPGPAGHLACAGVLTGRMGKGGTSLSFSKKSTLNPKQKLLLRQKLFGTK